MDFGSISQDTSSQISSGFQQGGGSYSGRPILITVMCILGFLHILIILLATLVFFHQVTSYYGVTAFPMLIVEILVTAFSFYGCWKMMKWGVWLYSANFVLWVIYSFVIRLEVYFFIIPFFVTVCFLLYVRKME